VVHVLARGQRHARVFHLAADRRDQPADREPGPERQPAGPKPPRHGIAGGHHRSTLLGWAAASPRARPPSTPAIPSRPATATGPEPLGGVRDRGPGRTAPPAPVAGPTPHTGFRTIGPVKPSHFPAAPRFVAPAEVARLAGMLACVPASLTARADEEKKEPLRLANP